MASPSAVALGPGLTPTQQRALADVLGAVSSRAVELVELRSPPALGRGHGVTAVLRAAAKALGAPLLGPASVLDAQWDAPEGQGASAAIRSLHRAAQKSLQEHGVAIVDDLDLAAAPHAIRRSRTLIGEIRGAGDIHNWEVAPAPAMLLKALGDVASACGGAVLFSSVEDAHLSFMKAPLAVALGEPTEADYAALLKNVPSLAGLEVDSASLFALHSQLSPADVLMAATRAAMAAARDGTALGTASLLAAVRSELVATSAVAPEEVEPVDLAQFPGMEEIKQELEKNVLFPMEHPELAAQLGLSPKRGVLLHGKPGTGKTTVGRWLAHRLRGKFFLVREMMVQADIIKVFAAAQAAAPSVVFIDDADIIIGGWRPLDGHRGSDIFRFLLGRMDGLTSRGKRQRENGDVVVMLTGQNVHWMAEMLLRSGRIELWLKTKLPEPAKKREILRKYVAEDPGALELLGKDGAPPDVRAAAKASDLFCCADLRRVVSDAKMLAAWDRQAAAAGSSAAPQASDGAGYLEKAAQALRSMQDEVHENMRSMYG